MGKPVPATWVERAHAAFFDSGLTLYRLGLAMGFPDKTARHDAWQFLYRTPAPPAAVVRQFARAVGVPVTSLTRPDGIHQARTAATHLGRRDRDS